MAISPIPVTRNTLLFPGRLRRIIERLSAVVYPYETCGLLIGASDGATTFVEEVTQTQNLNRRGAGERVAVEPDDFHRAERIAIRNGLEVVGIWRSNPNGVGVPAQDDLDVGSSQDDLAAASSGYSFVIVSVAADRAPETRSWRLDGDRVVEEDVQS